MTAVPIMRELFVPRLLSREELRALCDREGDPEQIVATLRRGT